MKISPRYEGPPIIAMTGTGDDIREAMLRQRRRLASLILTFGPEQWNAPSRCEAWSVRDVVAHLVGTDRFWLASIDAGLAGTPTRFLAGFDPKAAPAALVDATRSTDAETVAAQYTAGAAALCDAVESLTDAGWEMTAEAPPGHLPMRIVAHHALWDSWVHERDIVLPLDLAPTEEADEVTACLRYAAALGPAFAITAHDDRRGTVVVEASDPATRVVVEFGSHVAVHDGPAAEGAPVVTGNAVDLVEGLSMRTPLGPLADHDLAGLFTGLAEVFESELG